MSFHRIKYKIEDVTREFLRSIPESLSELSLLLQQPGKIDDHRLGEALKLVRSITEYSEKLGLHDISRIGIFIESLFLDIILPTMMIDARSHGICEQYIDTIRGISISTLQNDEFGDYFNKSDDHDGSRLNGSPDYISSVRNELMRRVIVISPDKEDYLNMAMHLDPVGYHVEWRNHLTDLVIEHNDKSKLALAISAKYLADITTENEQDWQKCVEFCQSYPVVFISNENSLTQRLKALRMGAKGILQYPLAARTVVNRMDTLTGAITLPPDRVLVVDDSKTVAQFYSDVLNEAGLITLSLSDPMVILEAIQQFAPDLILMDIHMPSCNGDELISILRQQEQWIGIPIIAVSGDTNEKRHIHAMRCGASDFLQKPVEPNRLVERVLAQIERHRAMRMYLNNDGLTGLLNHARLHDAIASETRRAVRTKEPLSLAIIDLDHFKLVNDQYGHLAGDVVLRNLSRLMIRRLRQTDIAGRYGGEEFCVLFPETGLRAAKDVMDQLRTSFEHLEHRCGNSTFHVTFSVGITACTPEDDGDSFLYRADKALYRAKRGGRNKISVEVPKAPLKH